MNEVMQTEVRFMLRHVRFTINLYPSDRQKEKILPRGQGRFGEGK